MTKEMPYSHRHVPPAAWGGAGAPAAAGCPGLWVRQKPAEPGFWPRGGSCCACTSPVKGTAFFLSVCATTQDDAAEILAQYQNRLHKVLNLLQPKFPVTAVVTHAGRNATSAPARNPRPHPAPPALAEPCQGPVLTRQRARWRTGRCRRAGQPGGGERQTSAARSPKSAGAGQHSQPACCARKPQPWGCSRSRAGAKATRARVKVGDQPFSSGAAPASPGIPSLGLGAARGGCGAAVGKHCGVIAEPGWGWGQGMVTALLLLGHCRAFGAPETTRRDLPVRLVPGPWKILQQSETVL